MLYLNMFRENKGGDLKGIRERLRRRFVDDSLVDEIVKLDKAWRSKLSAVGNIRRELEKITEQVVLLNNTGEDASELIRKADENKKFSSERRMELNEVWVALTSKLELIETTLKIRVIMDKNLVRKRRMEPKLKDHMKTLKSFFQINL
ncbi:hypothetical protein ACFE04_008440 [Oxalis oulophora]